MFQLVLVCFYVGFGQSNGDAPVLSRIPDIINYLCPGSDICLSNRSSGTADDISFKPGLESCCAECSCSAECPETGNCCFPDALLSKNHINGKLEKFQHDRSCFYPTLPYPARDENLYQSFFMVSSVQNISSGGQEGLSNSSCGDINVAPWGSFYPVYSAKSGLIYKNIECAKQDGEDTDVIIWDAVIKCTDTDVKQSISMISSGTEQDSFYESCQINFIFPGTYDDLQPLKCYTNLIDTCPESHDFQVPVGINVSKDDIRTLCTKSGMVSPYRLLKMYANVFCHICNGEDFIHNIFCPKYGEDFIFGGKSGIGEGFIALIDGNFIAVTSDRHHSKVKELPTACAIKDENSCRQILCPSGQLRDRTNKCVYPTNIWYNQIYAVYINLTLDKSINMSEVFDIPLGNKFSSVLPSLESTWLRRWFIHSINCRVMDDESYMSNNVIIIMHRKLSKVKPDILITNIKKMIGNTWSMRLGNTTEVLKSANFSMSLSFWSQINRSKDYKSYNITEKLEKPQYKLVYNSNISLQKAHIITGLYICVQVELEPSEFLLLEDNRVLYIYISKRFIFDGRFALMRTFGETRARICIEDSGLYERGRNVATILQNVYPCFLVASLLSIFLQVAVS
ncbi:uncharacterized protein LOC132753843 [Ruditapes philippinarum]|uniref:uncharacterized protein LOC132753843 n=1 Tax=Ruditapes philippinarum TaxID=129788 RepID=UPI00295ABB6E|nr:uncharacterized protein LOC132753843 [Ruditapes philippinarum]